MGTDAVDPADPSLHGHYRRALAAHGFSADPAQQRGIAALDRLRHELIAADEEDASVANRLLRRLASAGGSANRIRGVYLWGGVGRGKTWLMDLFFHSLPFERRRRSHFHRFMHDVHAQLKSHRRKADPLAHVAADLAATARVICFDELFVSDIADAMILGTLFGHLAGRGVTFVFTSNVPPGGLYRDGLQRQKFLPAIALLEQQTEVLALDGTADYRLRHLTRAAIYLQDAAPQAAAGLAAIFTGLADGAGNAGGAIEIEGRQIPVLRASDNVVWFEFAALCEGARGNDDYIEIAREYQHVLVSGVPVFDADHENAARRFVALVDEFYDRRVKLILAAAAAPADLYRGERLKFEFERTASRLVEMQSEAYLASEHRG